MNPRTRAALHAVGESQAGIVSRQQAYAVGATRGETRAEVSARRWRRIGRHCIALFTGPLPWEAQCWVALFEASDRAYLDGETALILAGLNHYDSDRIRVTVPRGARIRHRGTSVDIRQTRRWHPDDVATGPGPHRARPEVAAIHAALWARSERQATLLLTMTAQQGIATVPEMTAELLRVRRDRRRSQLAAVLLDLAGGVGSLHELDVLRGCRERGLPDPDTQALRRTKDGSYYLDFRWHRWAVTVEVDGIQHAWATHVVGDSLRHNRIAIDGDTVLRIPVLGLRVCPDDFFGQIEEALLTKGWRPGLAA